MSAELARANDENRPRLRVVPLDVSTTCLARVTHSWRTSWIITLAALCIAGLLGWEAWRTYMGNPWTRDALVRTDVATVAPEVAGRIVRLPVQDNQFVRKGDLLMVIDPTDYRIALDLAEGSVTQAEATAQNARTEAERRAKLTELAVSKEEQQSFGATARANLGSLQQAVANRDRARVNLERTEIRSPVNGWVTNLLVHPGDYATVGRNVISVVNADAFWIDAYMEETQLESIHEGDPASIKLMGYSGLLQGRVGSVAHGIDVSNARPNGQGLATVNPIFTWVRLAQRVPVRIQFAELPSAVRLVAGTTATVEVENSAARRRLFDWF